MGNIVMGLKNISHSSGITDNSLRPLKGGVYGFKSHKN